MRAPRQRCNWRVAKHSACLSFSYWLKEGMQTLKQYLEGKIKADFADQLGVSPSMLSQYLSGVRRPSYDRMIEIARITDGSVPVQSWEEMRAPQSDAGAA